MSTGGMENLQRSKKYNERASKSEKDQKVEELQENSSSTMKLDEASCAVLKPKKSFWKSISGIFRTRGSKGKRKKKDDSKDDTRIKDLPEFDDQKTDRNADDISSSEEEHVVKDPISSKPAPQVFQKEHVSEPLVEPLSEVSTGSGHEADDEAEDDSKEEAANKIRNAINELAAMNDDLLKKDCEDTALVEDEKRDSEYNNQLSTHNSKTDSERSKSIEDSYSFSYSDSSSAVSSETQEQKEDAESAEPKREGKESEKKSDDENNKDTICCRIITTKDTQSIENHHHHSKNFKTTEKNIENNNNNEQPSTINKHITSSKQKQQKIRGNIKNNTLMDPENRSSKEILKSLANEVIGKQLLSDINNDLDEFQILQEDQIEKKYLPQYSSTEGHLDDLSENYEECTGFLEDFSDDNDSNFMSSKTVISCETCNEENNTVADCDKAKKKTLSQKIIGYTEEKLKHVLLKNGEGKNNASKLKKLAPKPPPTENEDDISLAELKELEELSKYKNILKQKIDYPHFKDKLQLSTKKCVEDNYQSIKINSNGFYKADFYYPEILDGLVVESDYQNFAVDNNIKYEGILKKGQTNKGKANLAVNFADEERSDDTAFSFDNSVQQNMEYNDLLQYAEKKVLSMNDTFQEIEDNLKDYEFLSEGEGQICTNGLELPESSLEAHGINLEEPGYSLPPAELDCLMNSEPVWKVNRAEINPIEVELKLLNDTLKEFHTARTMDMNLVMKMEDVLHLNEFVPQKKEKLLAIKEVEETKINLPKEEEKITKEPKKETPTPQRKLQEITIKVGIQPELYLDEKCITEIDKDTNWQSWKTKDERVIDEILDAKQETLEDKLEEENANNIIDKDEIMYKLLDMSSFEVEKQVKDLDKYLERLSSDDTTRNEEILEEGNQMGDVPEDMFEEPIISICENLDTNLTALDDMINNNIMKDECNDMELYKVLEEIEKEWMEEEKELEETLKDRDEIEELRQLTLETMIQEMQDKWIENEKKLEEVLKEASEKECVEDKAIEIPTLNEIEQVDNEIKQENDVKCNEILKNNDNPSDHQPQEIKTDVEHNLLEDNKPDLTEEEVNFMFQKMESNIKEKQFIKTIKKTANDVLKDIEQTLQYTSPPKSLSGLLNDHSRSSSSSTTEKNLLEARCGEILDNYDNEVDYLKRTLGTMHIQQQTFSPHASSSYFSNFQNHPRSKSAEITNDKKQTYGLAVIESWNSDLKPDTDKLVPNILNEYTPFDTHPDIEDLVIRLQNSLNISSSTHTEYFKRNSQSKIPKENIPPKDNSPPKIENILPVADNVSYKSSGSGKFRKHSKKDIDNVSKNSSDTLSTKSIETKLVQKLQNGVLNITIKTKKMASQENFDAPRINSKPFLSLDPDSLSNNSNGSGKKRKTRCKWVHRDTPMPIVQTEIQNRCTKAQQIISEERFVDDVYVKPSKGCSLEIGESKSASKIAPSYNMDLNKEIDELVFKLTNGLKISETSKPITPVFENKTGNFASSLQTSQLFNVYDMLNDNTLLQTPLLPTKISLNASENKSQPSLGPLLSVPNSSSSTCRNISKGVEKNEFPKLPFAEFSKLASDITNFKTDGTKSKIIKMKEDSKDANFSTCLKLEVENGFSKSDLSLGPNNLELPDSPTISNSYLDLKDICSNGECDDFVGVTVEFPKNVDDLVLPKTPIIKIPSNECATYHGQNSGGLFCGRNTINVHKRHLEPEELNGNTTMEPKTPNGLAPMIFGRLKAGSCIVKSEKEEPMAPKEESTVSVALPNTSNGLSPAIFGRLKAGGCNEEAKKEPMEPKVHPIVPSPVVHLDATKGSYITFGYLKPGDFNADMEPLVTKELQIEASSFVYPKNAVGISSLVFRRLKAGSCNEDADIEPMVPKKHSIEKPTVSMYPNMSRGVLYPVKFGRLKAGSCNEDADIGSAAPEEHPSGVTTVSVVYPNTLPFLTSTNELDNNANPEVPNQLGPGTFGKPPIRDKESKNSENEDTSSGKYCREPNESPVKVGADSIDFNKPSDSKSSDKVQEWEENIGHIGNPLTKYGLGTQISDSFGSGSFDSSIGYNTSSGKVVADNKTDSMKNQRCLQLKSFEKTVLGSDPTVWWGMPNNEDPTTVGVCPVYSSETLEELEVWSHKLEDDSKVNIPMFSEAPVDSPYYIEFNQNNLIYERNHGNDTIYYKMVYDEREKSHSIVYKPIKDGNEVIKSDDMFKIPSTQSQEEDKDTSAQIKKSKKDIFLLHGSKIFENFHGFKDSQTSFSDCFKRLFSSDDNFHRKNSCYSVPSNSPSGGNSNSSLRSRRLYLSELHKFKPKHGSCPQINKENDSSDVVKDEITTLESTTDLDETMLLLQIAKYKLLKMMEENENDLSERSLSYETEIGNLNCPVYMLDNISSNDAFQTYSPPRKYHRRKKEEQILDWSSDEEALNANKNTSKSLPNCVTNKELPNLTKMEESLKDDEKKEQDIIQNNRKNSTTKNDVTESFDNTPILSNLTGIEESKKDLSDDEKIDQNIIDRNSVGNDLTERVNPPILANVTKMEESQEDWSLADKIDQNIIENNRKNSAKKNDLAESVDNTPTLSNVTNIEGNNWSSSEDDNHNITQNSLSVLSNLTTIEENIWSSGEDENHIIQNNRATRNDPTESVDNTSTLSNHTKMEESIWSSGEDVSKTNKNTTENDYTNILRSKDPIKHVNKINETKTQWSSDEETSKANKNASQNNQIIINNSDTSKNPIEGVDNTILLPNHTKKEETYLKTTSSKNSKVSIIDHLAELHAKNMPLYQYTNNVPTTDLETTTPDEQTGSNQKALIVKGEEKSLLSISSKHKIPMFDFVNYLVIQVLLDLSKSYIYSLPVKQNEISEFIVNASNNIVEFLAPQNLAIEYNPVISQKSTENIIELASYLDVENEIKVMVKDLTKEFDELKTMCIDACKTDTTKIVEEKSNANKIVKDILNSVLDNIHEAKVKVQEESNKEIDVLRTKKEKEILEELKEEDIPSGNTISANILSKNIINNILDNVYNTIDKKKEEIKEPNPYYFGESTLKYLAEKNDNREMEDLENILRTIDENESFIREVKSISENNIIKSTIEARFKNNSDSYLPKGKSKKVTFSNNEEIGNIIIERILRRVYKDIESKDSERELENKKGNAAFERHSKMKKNTLGKNEKSNPRDINLMCYLRNSVEFMKNISKEMLDYNIFRHEEENLMNLSDSFYKKKGKKKEEIAPNSTKINNGEGEENMVKTTKNNVTIKDDTLEEMCLEIDEDIEEELGNLDYIADENVDNKKKVKNSYQDTKNGILKKEKDCFDVNNVGKPSDNDLKVDESKNIDKSNSSLFTLKGLFHINDSKKKEKKDKKIETKQSEVAVQSKKSSISTFAFSFYNLLMRRSNKSVKLEEENNENVAKEETDDTKGSPLQNSAMISSVENKENKKNAKGKDNGKKGKFFNRTTKKCFERKGGKIDKKYSEEHDNMNSTCSSLFNYNILAQKVNSNTKDNSKRFSNDQIEDIRHKINDIIKKRIEDVENFDKSPNNSDNESSSDDSKKEDSLETDEILTKFLKYKGKIDVEKKILDSFGELKENIIKQIYDILEQKKDTKEEKLNKNKFSKFEEIKIMNTINECFTKQKDNKVVKKNTPVKMKIKKDKIVNKVKSNIVPKNSKKIEDKPKWNENFKKCQKNFCFVENDGFYKFVEKNQVNNNEKITPNLEINTQKNKNHLMKSKEGSIDEGFEENISNNSGTHDQENIKKAVNFLISEIEKEENDAKNKLLYTPRSAVINEDTFIDSIDIKISKSKVKTTKSKTSTGKLRNMIQNFVNYNYKKIKNDIVYDFKPRSVELKNEFLEDVPQKPNESKDKIEVVASSSKNITAKGRSSSHLGIKVKKYCFGKDSSHLLNSRYAEKIKYSFGKSDSSKSKD